MLLFDGDIRTFPLYPSSENSLRAAVALTEEALLNKNNLVFHYLTVLEKGAKLTFCSHFPVPCTFWLPTMVSYCTGSCEVHAAVMWFFCGGVVLPFSAHPTP